MVTYALLYILLIMISSSLAVVVWFGAVACVVDVINHICIMYGDDTNDVGNVVVGCAGCVCIVVYYVVVVVGVYVFFVWYGYCDYR